MRVVVRHLVDEQRRAAAALDAGVFQILPAVSGRLRGGHPRQRRIIGARRRIGFAPVQVLGHRDDVGQLHRAFHLRMAGQDLLEQSGAGTRHAEDEDRIAVGHAEIGTFGEERGIEQALVLAQLQGVAVGAVLNETLAPMVAGLIVRERGLVQFLVF